MRTDLAVLVPVRLEDYQPPAFRVETADLRFDLQPTATRVHARLHLVRQGETDAPPSPWTGGRWTPTATASNLSGW